jgi:ADP-heptose:LPS heptosyltransferase
MRKVLFVIGDGIGNQFQTIPAFLFCQRKFGQVSVYNSIPTQTEATKVIFGKMCNEIFYSNSKINRRLFKWQILTAACYGSSAKQIKILNEKLLKKKDKYSEVMFNLLSVGDDYSDKDFKDALKVFDYLKVRNDIPDILIHDGYSKVTKGTKNRWLPKSYPKYRELAEYLIGLGYSVGSLGGKDEYIEGTADLTGMKLKHSIGAIKSCKLLISNDTSTYHIANVLKIPNIVIYTFTDPKKNYCKKFHKYSHIIRLENSECSPCQLSGGYDYWQKNKSVCKWKCRDIPVENIVERVKEVLK